MAFPFNSNPYHIQHHQHGKSGQESIASTSHPPQDVRKVTKNDVKQSLQFSDPFTFNNVQHGHHQYSPHRVQDSVLMNQDASISTNFVNTIDHPSSFEEQRPSLNQSQQRIVDNYNAKAEYNGDYMKQRSNARTKHVRDMNNWLKYMVITYSIGEAFHENNGQKINVLDLGCGKGGDLYKFRGNKQFINHYVGIDLASKCIESARRKLQSMIQDQQRQHRNGNHRMRTQNKKRFSRRNAYNQTAEQFYDEPLFTVDLLCGDMTSVALKQHRLIIQRKPFHLLNVQFALHYAFQSTESWNLWLDLVDCSTERGSFLVCSMVRDTVLLNRLHRNWKQRTKKDQQTQTVKFENALQSISMKQSDFNKVMKEYQRLNLWDEMSYGRDEDLEAMEHDERDYSKLIGIPYTYYQEDSVEGDGNGVEEYLVPFHVLCVMLWKKCRMRLEWCDDGLGSERDYCTVAPYKYGYLKRGLDKVRWAKSETEVVQTYQYALFLRLNQCE